MILRIKNEGKAVVVEDTNNKISTKLKLNSSYFDKNLNKDIKYGVKNVPGGCVIMFGAGIISGLLGIGSGIFKVIAMDTVMKMPLKPSSATSNLMMGVTAAASAIVYFFSGSILPEVAVPLIIGVLAGSAIGSRIMPKLHPIVIRVLFVIIIGVFCIQMITKAFSVL